MRWIIAALLVLPATNLFAQAADSRGYVFGGLTMPWEQGVTTDEHRTYLAAPGGWSAGLILGGGARLHRVLSVDAEWHRTGIMEATEPSRYSITYVARRRDVTWAVGTRFHAKVSPHLTFEPVALAEFVRERSWLGQRRDALAGAPPGDASDVSPYVDSWGSGLAAGVDVRAGGRHLALLPGVRVHHYRRGTDAIGVWPGGRANRGVEVTIAARADF